MIVLQPLHQLKRRLCRDGLATLELAMFLPLFAIVIMFFLAMGKAGDTAIMVSANARATAFSERDGKSSSKALAWPPNGFAGELESGSASASVNAGGAFGTWGPLENEIAILDNPWDYRSVEFDKLFDREKYGATLGSLPNAAGNSAIGLLKSAEDAIGNPMGALAANINKNKGEWKQSANEAEDSAENAEKQVEESKKKERERLDGENARLETQIELRRSRIAGLLEKDESSKESGEDVAKQLMEVDKQILKSGGPSGLFVSPSLKEKRNGILDKFGDKKELAATLSKDAAEMDLQIQANKKAAEAVK